MCRSSMICFAVGWRCRPVGSPVPLEAVDGDVLTGDVERLRSGEEGNQFRHVARAIRSGRAAIPLISSGSRLAITGFLPVSSVLISPGQTQLIAISGPSSLASARVMPMIPAFAAA